jgi:hypothetical protein
MALGSYGTIRPSDVSPDDVEIILLYTESRDVTNNFTLKKLNAPSILTPYFHNTTTGGNPNVEVLGGLYNLQLPAAEFNALGIYTLVIRPIEIRTLITDCGVLSALPNVNGLVVDLNNVPQQFRNKFINQGLVGFRIEYLNNDGTKIPNFFRIVRPSQLKMVFTPFMILITISTNNTTYLKSETNSVSYFTKFVRIEVIILILVKTSTQ